MICDACGRIFPEKMMIKEERWPYNGGVRPANVPSHVRGILLPICADREDCANHIQMKRLAAFVRACQGTGSLSAGSKGHYLFPD